MWEDEVVTVNYIGTSYAFVTDSSNGIESLACLSDLTQPKEGGV